MNSIKSKLNKRQEEYIKSESNKAKERLSQKYKIPNQYKKIGGWDYRSHLYNPSQLR